MDHRLDSLTQIQLPFSLTDHLVNLNQLLITRVGDVFSVIFNQAVLASSYNFHWQIIKGH